MPTLFHGLVDVFVVDLLNGLHQSGDTYMLALYRSGDSPLGHDTSRYTPKGEVAVSGYTTGGIALSERTVKRQGRGAVLSFAPVAWKHLTVKDVDTALVYNATREARAIGVLRFEPTSARNGPLAITSPIVFEVGR